MDDILSRLQNLMRDVTGADDSDDARRTSSVVRLAAAELSDVTNPSEAEMIDALLDVMREDDLGTASPADIVVTDPNDFEGAFASFANAKF